MKDRDVIAEFSSEWLESTDASLTSVEAALRKRARRILWFGLEFISGCVAAATGVYLLLSDPELVHSVAAVVLLGYVAVSWTYNIRSRRYLFQWGDWTSEGILRFRLNDCDAAIRHARRSIWSSVVLAIFAAFVWVAAEYVPGSVPDRFHYLYASVVAPVVIAWTLWGSWRIGSKKMERKRLEVLIADFQDDYEG